MSLIKGTLVEFETRGGTMTGTFSHTTKTNLAYIRGEDNRPYERKVETVRAIGQAPATEGSDSGQVAGPIKPQFSVTERFQFLDSLIRMTIKGKRKSLIIVGEGGLGKTYSVKQQLRNSSLITDTDPEVGDYKIIKGFTTAKGLYNTLYYWRNKLVIFDDCDEVFKNDIATGILKGALDSYDERWVSWVTNKEGGEIPNEFLFEGRIIFISNLNRKSIDQAILSRSSVVDLEMSSMEKMERMKVILNAPSFMPEVKEEVKARAYEVLMQFADSCKNLTIRTLIEVIDYANGGEEEWERLAEYAIKTSGL